MSWTNDDHVIRVMVYVHDDAPEGLAKRVGEIVREGADHIRDRLADEHLDDSFITTEVWG